jgi:hypothetical protein
MRRLSLESHMLKMLCSMCDYYPVKNWAKDLAGLSSQIHPEARQSSSSVCGHEPLNILVLMDVHRILV